MFYEELSNPSSSKDPKRSPPSMKKIGSKQASALHAPLVDPSKLTKRLCPSRNAKPIKHVYVVKQEIVLQQPLPIFTERDQIIAIYATPRDANLRVYKIVKQRKENGGCLEGYDVLGDAEGLLSWSTFQHGGSENGIYVFVDKMEVLPAGAEPDEE